MERRLIFRGLLAGGLAGLLTFLFARIFAEPQINEAINYESGRDAAQETLDKTAGFSMPGMGAEPFSRAVQSTVGIGVGIIAFGLAMGGLLAVVYCLAYGRVGVVRARTLALLTALAGFLTIFLIPFVKYPANPPAIGHEDTIKARSGLYLLMVVAAVVLGVIAVVAARSLRHRYSTWTTTLLVSAGYLVLIGALMAILPSVGHLSANQAQFGDQATETPLPLRAPDGSIVFPGFPADVLAQFRLYAVGAQLLLWSGIGLIFAPLAERVLEPHRLDTASAPAPELSTAR